MSDSLITKLESLLYISNKPLSYKKLAELAETGIDDIKQLVTELKDKYNQNGSGIKLLDNGHSLQMATAPEANGIVEEFLKQELTGEMTKPQLETLTVIAYRGPILKTALEQIRGVNCSLILRNLMIRGLVEIVSEQEDKIPRYQITMDFLRYLGISSTDELPDYDTLSRHEFIDALLEKQTVDQSAVPEAGEPADREVNE